MDKNLLRAQLLMEAADLLSETSTAERVVAIEDKMLDNYNKTRKAVVRIPNSKLYTKSSEKKNSSQ